MPTITNKDIAAALKAARPLIESGHQQFICYALDQWIYRGSPHQRAAAQAAKEIIHQLLGDDYTLGNWVVNQRLHRDPPMDVMREFRLRWMDSLIKEFDR